LPQSNELRREVGLGGAMMMGLGSIIGTGVYVSIAIAAGSAGPSVLLAIAVAAVVATCNGLSSAQLAAAHPVSGGTYEYGYRWLAPSLGFTAGWMFVCAKSASAATAALGFSGYLLNALDADSRWLVAVALVAVLVLVIVVLSGIRQSSQVNIAVVSLSLLALAVFVFAMLPTAWRAGTDNLRPFFAPLWDPTAPWGGFLEACALMFVAYTGYGRIATLGEEIVDPARNIPRAVIATLLVSMVIYITVATVGVASVGAPVFAIAATEEAAPLEVVASESGLPMIANFVALGAMAAMLGVLLNLVLGLSRVVLAMGRRSDLPPLFGQLNAANTTPIAAVILVGVVIAALVTIGNVRTTWSFSAFTVLMYYALTNLAALQLTPSERLYPRFIPWLGLCSCLFLAFWVDREIWLVGLALIVIGLIWQQISRRMFGKA